MREMRWLSSTRPPGSGSAVVAFDEAFECRRDQPWQCVEVVAALEHGRTARSRCRAAAGELAEAVLGEAQVGERVVLVSVEAGRDEQELRLEAGEGRLDDPVERAAGS